jgi:predicted DNA-binding transcriptional regulator YafY
MQINRLFEIVYILLDKKLSTSKELAERFEVSTRTIYRDIEILSSAGIPVYMSKGKGGGISLLSNFVLNKSVLTEEEKNNILSSLKALNSVNLSETDNAIEKLSSLFGETNTDWVEVDFTSWYNVEEEKNLFCNLKTAILSKNAVSFSYSSGKGESINRHVYPLKLCFKGQRWYLYGYCNTRYDNRFFKLTRIKEFSILEENFQKKAPVQIFSEKKIINDDFILLKLKISKTMAYRVYDEFKTYKHLEDGSFIAEIMYPKGEWIFNYIASFGEDCEVLSPEEVRNDVKRKLQKIIENYL